MKKYLLLVLTCFIIISCSYNKKELIKSSSSVTPAATTTITYTNFVKTLIDSSHCLNCHVPGVGQPAPWDYRTYNDLKTVALSGALKARVIDRIGSNPMPKGFPALSQANRDTLLLWINQGAKQ